MYLARLSVGPRLPPETKRAILEAVETALRLWARVDQSEIFLILNEHSPSDFRLNKKFVAEASSKLVLVQISFSRQTDDELAHSENPANDLFEQVASQLYEKAHISKSDVLITVLEVPKQNQTSGLGIFNWISLAPRPVFKPRGKSSEVLEGSATDFASGPSDGDPEES